jgi:hypothetical protein
MFGGVIKAPPNKLNRREKMNKNDGKLLAMNLHTRYEYHRYDDNSVLTVCNLERTDRGIIARGLAICSTRDVFNKAEGRSKSLGRAIAAVEHRSALWPVQRTDNKASIECRGLYKAEFWG